jgi:hypothetical protein
MATGLSDFGDRVRRVASAIEKNAPLIQRKVATAIFQAVRDATPVGKPALWNEPKKAARGYVGGSARASWMIGIGAPATGVSEPGGGEDGAGLIASAPAGTSIHITNNEPYIRPLNDGHSHQAPVGFVDTAIQTGLAAITGASLLEGA